jgi:hypothetical protein
MGGVIEKHNRIVYEDCVEYGTEHADVKKMRCPD